MKGEPFLRPTLKGLRFEGGAVPLCVLADFAALEKMIVEAAKWKFRVDHPERKRVPRGFAEAISVKLTDIEDGSAILNVVLFFAQSGLLPPAAKDYFEGAREAVVRCIGEAEKGQPIRDLPPEVLAHFTRFGRSLEAGEAVVFEDSVAGLTATLTQETRRRLVLASNIDHYFADVVLHGIVTGAELKQKWFHLQQIAGSHVAAPLSDSTVGVVMDAFNSYAAGSPLKVRVCATGRFDREQKLMAVEDVDSVEVIDPLDIRARVEELRNLRDGWLDGAGIAPSEADLNWVVAAFAKYYPAELRLPYLFATVEGRVLAEWNARPWALTLEIDGATRRGEWHSLNVDSDEEIELSLDLNSQSGWEQMAEELRDKGMQANDV